MAYLFSCPTSKYKIKKTITLEGVLRLFPFDMLKKCCFVNLFHKGFVLFRFSLQELIRTLLLQLGKFLKRIPVFENLYFHHIF